MVAGMAAIGLATGLAACGNSDNSSESGNSDGNIVMWTRAPLERQAKNAVEAYNSDHENQVSLEILSNDDVEGRVGAAIQTDSLPCLLAGDVVRIPYWTQQGVFMDLTDRIDALPEVDDLQQGHIDAGELDGAKHTLPFVTDISVMAWNKDLYEQADLDPEQGPTSIDEYVEQAQAVAALDEPGVSGSYFAGSSGGALAFMLFPSIWAEGEEVLNADGTEALLSSDAAQAVYDGYREIAETPNGMGAGSQEENGATWSQPFADGNVGVMAYPYTAATPLFEEADFEVGIAPILGVTGGESTFLGGDALGIPTSCEQADEAWDFLAWLMTEDAQQEVFADNDDTASNLNVLANGYGDADPRTQIANDVVAEGRTPVAINFNEAFNAAGSPWQTLIQNAVFDDGSQVETDVESINSILNQ